jgi:hypothetical protein
MYNIFHNMKDYDANDPDKIMTCSERAFSQLLVLHTWKQQQDIIWLIINRASNRTVVKKSQYA